MASAGAQQTLLFSPPPVRSLTFYPPRSKDYRTDEIAVSLAGDDCQLLLWDLNSYTMQGSSPRTASSGLSSPRPETKKRTVLDPVMAYTGPGEITSLAWSPQIAGMSIHGGITTAPGEWVAITMGKTIQALKV